MMNGAEKSDPAIVATKLTNKAEQPSTERSAREPYAAESAERRVGIKGNAGQQSTRRTQSWASGSQALERIREVARERKKEKFTALYHHINIDLLEEAFFELKTNAAPGVDRLTWKGYEAGLECNLEDLHHRVQRGEYRACRTGGSISPSQMAGSARSRSQHWRTRSSNGQWSRC
jgi:RNA-directed DNA polymerase